MGANRENECDFGEKGTPINVQKSDKISKGTFLRDVWSLSKINPMAKERNPTQKPVALYERMIKASSNQAHRLRPVQLVRGTTLDAAHTLGRALDRHRRKRRSHKRHTRAFTG